MENPLTREIEIPQISSKEIWGEFEKLQMQTQSGPQSYEAKLGIYGKFLHRFNLFLSQPSLANPSVGEKELIGKLVYEHRETASLPVDFFVELGEQVNKKVLADGKISKMGKKWPEELDLMRRLVKQELHAATFNFNTEKQAAESLKTLAQNTPENEAKEAITGELASIEERKQQVQKTVIAALAKEPEFAKDITDNQNLVGILRGLIDNPDLSPQVLREVLAPYRNFLTRLDGSMWEDDLYVRLSIGQNESVKGSLRTLLDLNQAPDFIWKHWMSKGVIPPSFLESYDEILTIAELQESARIIGGLSKEKKAACLLSYIERGISAQLLNEIAEGRYQFEDSFLAKQVDAFLHFYDTFEAHSKGRTLGKTLSRKQKIAMAAITGAIVASPFIFGRLGEQSLPSQNQAAEQGQKNPTPKESEKAGVKIILEGSEVANYYGRENSIKPTNDSPESFKQAEKTTLWNLSGRNLNGYYREMVASRFMEDQKSWNTYEVFQQSGGITGTKKDITISQTLTIPGPSIALPVKTNYKITQDGVKVNGSNASWMEMTEGGNWFLNFPNEQIGKTVTIEYSLEESSSAIPNPSPVELQDMAVNLVDIDSLPDDIKNLSRKISSDTGLSPLEKAKILEDYIKQNFLYSLDQRWSDFYHQAGNTNDFIRRIFTIRKTDCDVANTALLALLRSQKVPARMAFGFIHKAGGPNYEKLRASEKHGWVEVYIDGRWVTLDATPVKKDDYTKKMIGEEAVTPWDVGNMEFSQELVEIVESLKAWGQENQIASALILAEVLNLLAFGASFRFRGGNKRQIDKLITEVKSRAKRQYGDRFPSVVDQFIHGEVNKLEGEEKVGDISAGIFPFGISALALDLLRQRRLNILPYNSQLAASPITSSSEPNAADFFINTLGYSEKKVQRDLRNRLYQEADDQVQRQMDTLFRQTFSFRYRDFYTPFMNNLEKMPVPQNSEEWEMIKTTTAQKLYRKYLENHRHEVRERLKNAGKRKIQTPQLLTKKEFDARFEEFSLHQMLRWQMKRTFQEALRQQPS